MKQQVLLKLDGDLNSGVSVTLEIWSAKQRELEMTGSLPPNSELATCLQDHWENKYRTIGSLSRIRKSPKIEQSYRIKSEEIIYDGSVNRRVQECRDSAKEVSDRFLKWLDAPEFRRIDRQLRDQFSLNQAVQVLIQTSDRGLQKLPWHLWDWVESRQAEIALSLPEYHKITIKSQPQCKTQVRILAILGHAEGINVEEDRQLLQNLPDAEVMFLVEPTRREIHDQLWEQPWDVIFFAGHSETAGEKGRIYINPQDSLTICELKDGLKQAVQSGLKLAIFNSCDGLGLAQQLSDLQIPEMIVMREIVPDQVAQTFLKYFLTSFTTGKYFDQAVREARKRLQGLEDEFPCASWLPIIFQHPNEVAPTWQELLDKPLDEPIPSLPTPTLQIPSWKRVLAASVMITSLVMGVRSLGMLQSLELKALDGLMRLRPKEALDPRMLIVTVTEDDIQAQAPDIQRGSLSDVVLERLLQKLNSHKPRVIGLDIYRPFAVQKSHKELAKTFRSNDKLIVVCEIGGGEKSPSIPPPNEAPLQQVGFSDLPVDPDGIVRRQLLGMSPTSGCQTDKSFSFQIAHRYLSTEGIKFERTSQHSFRIGTVNFKKIERSTGGYHNLDTRGYQVMLNYRSSQAPALTVTVSDVLNDRVDPSWIQDRIILIGTTARSIQDGLLTPYSASYSPIQTIPGIFIQAQMVSQIISAVKDNRPLLRILPLWGEVVCILGGAILGEILLNLDSKRRSVIFYLLIGGFTLIVLSGISLMILIQGAWIPLVPLGLAFILAGAKKALFTDFDKNPE